MRSSLPVLALTGVAQSLLVPAQLRDAELRVANESAYTLAWTWGDQSGILYPSEVDVWRPNATSASAIQLLPVSGILAGISLTANLVAEIAWAPDRFPGDYPQQMARLAQTASNKQRLFPDGTPTPALPSTPSFTVAAASNVTKVFSLDAGTTEIQFMVNASGLVFSYSLLVLGNNSTEQYYGDDSAPGSPLPVPTPSLPFNVQVNFKWDTKVSVQVNNPGANQLNVFVSELLSFEAPGQNGAASSVIQPVPAAWQAPTTWASFNVSLAGGGGTGTVVAAAPGVNSNYLHGYSIGQDGANAVGRVTKLFGGVNLTDVDCRNVRQMDVPWGDHKGLKGPGAVTVSNGGGVASFVLVNQEYAVRP